MGKLATSTGKIRALHRNSYFFFFEQLDIPISSLVLGTWAIVCPVLVAVIGIIVVVIIDFVRNRSNRCVRGNVYKNFVFGFNIQVLRNETSSQIRTRANMGPEIVVFVKEVQKYSVLNTFIAIICADSFY